MTHRFPPQPETTKPLSTSRPSADARALLALRRSASKRTLGSPGPTPGALDEILRVAARVPDHRRLEPWRFIVMEDEARIRHGEAMASIRSQEDPELSAQDQADTEKMFLRAPSVIGVISSPVVPHKTPVWEQELSAGAVCHNLLLAANASGFAGVWLTEWAAFSKGVSEHFGLGDHERFAGFIYLGTATAPSPERPRPDMSTKIERV